MSLAAAQTRAAPRSLAAAGGVIAIFAFAFAMQMRFGAFGDISWLITVCEGWLDGRTPYVDLIETNPPAAILIYMPAVALARLLAWRPEIVVAAYGLGLAGLSVLASRRTLIRAHLLSENDGLWTLAALAAFALLPGRVLDERDFFAALLGLPFVALVAARTSGARPAFLSILVATFGLAAMVAIKPPYALVPLALAPYALGRFGARPLLWPELWGAAALFAAYVAWTFFAFPAYVRDVVPTIAAAYVPVRESLQGLALNGGMMALAALAALIFVRGRPHLAEPLIAVPALAAFGALCAYALQGKGWLYHLQPALSWLVIAGAGLWLRLPRAPRIEAAAALIAIATGLAAAVLNAPPMPTAIGLALVARFAMRLPAGEAGLAGLATLGFGALFGAICGLYSAPFPGAPDTFRAALRALGPHPRIAGVAEGLGVGFPLTREVGGVWVQRTQGLLMTAGARRLMDLHPDDAALVERLAPIIAADRDRLAEDIVANRPDAVLVSRHGARFHAWAMSDPKLSAALAPYRFALASGDPDWPVDLYLRQAP